MSADASTMIFRRFDNPTCIKCIPLLVKLQFIWFVHTQKNIQHSRCAVRQTQKWFDNVDGIPKLIELDRIIR
jgi:hypothetical protein